MRLRTLVSVALYSALFCACLSVTNGQSGRRLPNSKPAAEPSPEATPTPRPTPKPTPEQEITVTMERGGAFDFVPLHFYSMISDTCAHRLNDSASVHADSSTKDTTRSDAINQAKSLKVGYVVWLNLRGSTSDGLYIEYYVYAATTGKTVTAGNAYQRAAKAGNVVISPPTPRNGTTAYTEYRLKMAAEDVADRILDALNLAPAGHPTFPVAAKN